MAEVDHDAAAVHLVDDALARGARTVFLSATDAVVARIYARLGFRKIGTAMIAEPVAPNQNPSSSS